MKRLLRFLKGYEKESFLAPLFKMLEATFELIVPLVVARIMDIGIKNQDNVYIWHQCVIMVLLGVIGLACSLTAQYFSAKAAMGFSTALRKELFFHISRLSYRELDMLGTPTLVTRITNDVNQAQTGVNMVLRLFLRSPFIVVGAVIMSFTIDVKIGLIFLIAVPVISIVIYGIMRTTVPIYKKAQSFLDRISLITRENHVGARVVRAFGRQQEEYKEFSEVNDDYTNVQVRAGKISALLNPATTVIMNFSIIGILWYGSREVSVGILTQGEVVALVNYMNQILIALIALANLIVAVTKAMASGVRLNEVLDTQPSLTDQGSSVQKENAGAARVVFEDVSFTYAGSKEPALSHISFTAKPGETIGIIGGTGCGKSTLVNLIPRFYDVTSGNVVIDGNNVKEYPFSQLRKKVGMVPQQAVLFKGTIRDNMKWGKEDASEEEIQRALSIAQASDFVKSKPEGLNTMVSQGGANLSGGQRQRVALGRAIVKNQKLFLMDEPLSNLDAKLRVSMRSEISKLHRQLGSTTIYVTHDQVEAMTMADRIVIMKDGVIQQVGKPMDLYEHPANKFVAVFIGSPQMNFYAVKVTGTTMTFSDGNKMHLPESVVSKLNGRQGAFILGIRGEDIKLDPQNLDLYKNNIMSATVDSVEVMGNENNLYFNFGGTGSVARVSKYEISKPGDTIDFTFVPSRMHFFDTQTEESLF